MTDDPLALARLLDLEPPDYLDDGEWHCGIHDAPLDPRYGCRYCPGGGLS